jgi:hypothetical protein
MIEYLEFHEIDTIATRVSGKITSDEFNRLKKEITEKIQLYEKVNWYYEMTEFEGWDWKAFFADIAFSLRNTSRFKKIAFIGETKVENIMAQVSKLFTPAEVKYFDVTEREAARDWIRYGLNPKD